jgi:hypothetical protein
MHDDRLWDAFSRSRLPEKEWTHRAHLRVAWLFSRDHPLDDAHVLMRVGIIRLNAFHGLVETTSRGYHETITRVWLVIVRSLMQRAAHESSEAFVDAWASELGKDALLRHYSRERLMSVEARARFVEPDLLALP